MTKMELEKLPTSQILDLFNQATGRSTKKFASRAKGIEQTLRALNPDGVEQEQEPEKPKATRRSSGLSFRLAPKGETKTPRAGSKRARVLEMISKPEGALFSEIQAACNWDLKDAYEGVRLLNVSRGYGLWHEDVGGTDYRIFQVDQDTFETNVRAANVEA